MKVAVILSGCGVFDGAEINEAVLTFLQLEAESIDYATFAPNINQTHVINHITGKEEENPRNVLTESARIVRGQIEDLSTLDHEKFDGVVVIGGFGVAKNLSDLAFKGATFEVNAELASILYSFVGKPALYMCIAPVLASKIYKGAKLTIGNDEGTIALVESNGCEHVLCDSSSCVMDNENQLVSTPAFMLAGSVSEAYIGIKAAVNSFKNLLL